MVSEGTGPSGCKGGGGGGRGKGRGECKVSGGYVGGNDKEPKTWDTQYYTKYIIGKESSVSMESVLGLEPHHPIMSTI